MGGEGTQERDRVTSVNLDTECDESTVLVSALGMFQKTVSWLGIWSQTQENKECTLCLEGKGFGRVCNTDFYIYSFLPLMLRLLSFTKSKKTSIAHTAVN